LIQVLGILLGVCLTQAAFAQSSDRIIEEFRQHVTVLSSDTMQGRSDGSLGQQRSNQYFCSQLYPASSLKKLRFHYDNDATLQVKSEMYCAFIDRHAKETVLITAHIDHLGFGGELSKSPGNQAVHPGADDNASGVAMLILLHNSLVHQPTTNLNYLFVALTGHEIGLKGSEFLSKHWRHRWKKLAGMLNFDMIGRMDSLNPVLYVSSNTTVPLSAERFDFKIIQSSKERVNMLDTKYFLQVPCLTYTTGLHLDYHKTSDQASYINYIGLKNQLTYFSSLLQEGWPNMEK
jgi:hypothetical protein